MKEHQQKKGSRGISALLAATLLLPTFGCHKSDAPKETQQKTTPADPVSSIETRPQADDGNAPDTGIPSAAMNLPPEKVLKNVGFVNPGGIIVDEKNDVYLVSNAGPAPLETDNTGFISKVSPDGQLIELKWIEGGKEGAVLTSPKGMAIRGDTLYVADVNTLRKFDAATGKATGEIRFEKAGYLNDIAVSDDGILYITDTGLAPLQGTLVANDTDCIYSVDKKDRIAIVLKSKALKQPNGLILDDTGFLVVSYSIPVLLSVSNKGEVKEISQLPGDRLDGIVKLQDGRLLITSWRASTVFVGPPEGPFKTFKDGLDGPGDLTFDAKRNQVIIPAAKEGALHIQPLGSAPNSASAAAPAIT